MHRRRESHPEIAPLAAIGSSVSRADSPVETDALIRSGRRDLDFASSASLRERWTYEQCT